MREPSVISRTKTLSRTEALTRAALGAFLFGLSVWIIDTIAIALPTAVVAVVLLGTAVTRECPVCPIAVAARHRSVAALFRRASAGRAQATVERTGV